VLIDPDAPLARIPGGVRPSFVASRTGAIAPVLSAEDGVLVSVAAIRLQGALPGKRESCYAVQTQPGCHAGRNELAGVLLTRCEGCLLVLDGLLSR
jgi:hypothetical protein